MLIDLHGHHLTRGMMNLDPHWGPAWKNGTLNVGDWYLGTKKLPDLTGIKDDSTRNDDGSAIFSRNTHEFRRGLMEKLGVDKLIISVPAHMYMYWTGDFGARFAATANDEFHAYCSEDPEHFGFWATVPMHQPVKAAAEIERAVTQLGAVGMSSGGANFGDIAGLHDRAFDPLWEKLTELDVPVMIHGYNQSVTWGARAMEDPFDTTSILGMCYDEARAFWHLTLGGVLDRFPKLTFYITHGGGFVPYQLHRFSETSKTMAPDSTNERPLLDYMDRFYFDPLVHSAAMRRAVVDDIGVDRLVYGSNFMGSDAIDFDLTEGIGLSDEDREKIRSGNAIAMLKLDQHAVVRG